MNGLYFNIQPQMRIQTANRWTCSNRQNYGGKNSIFFLVIDLDRRLSIVTLKSFVPSFCARPPRLRLLRQSADGHELVDRPKGEHHHGHGHHHLGGGSFLGMVAPMSIRICMCLYLYMYVCLHVCMSV